MKKKNCWLNLSFHPCEFYSTLQWGSTYKVCTWRYNSCCRAQVCCIHWSNAAEKYCDLFDIHANKFFLVKHLNSFQPQVSLCAILNHVYRQMWVFSLLTFFEQLSNFYYEKTTAVTIIMNNSLYFHLSLHFAAIRIIIN